MIGNPETKLSIAAFFSKEIFLILHPDFNITGIVRNFTYMITSSAVQILRTFSDKEIQLFEEFINTPFHNKNNKVIELFDLLKKNRPDCTTDENILRKILGNKNLRKSYIRNLFSDLNILLEKFLHHNLITKNFAYDRLLIEELKNRDLYQLAEKKIKSFEREVETHKVKDQEYFFNKNFIYEMKSYLVVDKTLTDNFRNEQVLSLLKLFMISLMENSLYLRVEEQRVKIKHDYDFLKNSLQYVQEHLTDFEDSPLLIIYHYLWLSLLNNGDEKNFLKARKHFMMHFNQISKEDKKNIYSGMQVYYIDRIDAGDASFNKEFLDFLLEMVKFNVLSHKKGDFIDLNLYRNILILCVMQKEIKILKNFISDFINSVSKKSRASILAYSNAHLNFLQNDFERTLELCNEINFNELLISTNDNLYFKNDIKALSLKCLFELEHFETAISAIDAFKHYLRHSKLMKDTAKRKFMGFSRYLSELIKLKMNFSEFDLKKLRQKIESDKYLIQKKWLTEKAAAMDVMSNRK